MKTVFLLLVLFFIINNIHSIREVIVESSCTTIHNDCRNADGIKPCCSGLVCYCALFKNCECRDMKSLNQKPIPIKPADPIIKPINPTPTPIPIRPIPSDPITKPISPTNPINPTPTPDPITKPTNPTNPIPIPIKPTPIDIPPTINPNICNRIIKGKDEVPEYNPESQSQACFIVKQLLNNSYNYATNILTNSKAMPGRASNNIFRTITCENIVNSSISDGLTYIGKEYPNQKPASGHYISLHISINKDHHWLRLDSNGRWSHKPGETPVTNVDLSGNLITDPSKINLYPFTTFCGYFNVIPSKTNIR